MRLVRISNNFFQKTVSLKGIRNIFFFFEYIYEPVCYFPTDQLSKYRYSVICRFFRWPLFKLSFDLLLFPVQISLIHMNGLLNFHFVAFCLFYFVMFLSFREREIFNAPQRLAMFSYKFRSRFTLLFCQNMTKRVFTFISILFSVNFIFVVSVICIICLQAMICAENSDIPFIFKSTFLAFGTPVGSVKSLRQA